MSLKRTIFDIIQPDSVGLVASKVFDLVITTLILVSVVIVFAVTFELPQGVMDALILVAGLAAFGEYLVYTIRSTMGHRFPFLWVTSVFVLAGIVRYVVLTWRKGGVGRPERILLSDRVLWLIIGGYAVAAVASVAISR